MPSSSSSSSSLSSDKSSSSSSILACHVKPITDSLGQIYSYHCGLHAWEQSGVVYDHSIVSANNDGLITPNIVELLEDISTDKGLFSGLKFTINPNAYWYYLQTANAYLKLSVENDPNIRIEIDSNYLSRYILTNSKCIGPKGTKGLNGITGIDGLPGPNEQTHRPQIIGNQLIINAPVQAPLDNPISVRLYQNNNLLVDIQVQLNSSSHDLIFIYPANSPIQIDQTSTLILDNGSVIGSLTLAGSITWPDNITYKARQIGTVGEKGLDGSSFLTVINSIITDPVVRATDALKDMHKSGIADIHYIIANIDQSMPVMHLRSNQDISMVTAQQSIGLLGSLVIDRWAGIDPILQPAKQIMWWGLTPVQVDQIADTVLDLPTWVPLKVVGNAGWQGFPAAEQIPMCAEDLFIAVDPLAPPVCPMDDEEKDSNAG